MKDVNPAIVERLLVENLVPVVSTIGSDLTGQAYNINADTVAGALAEALGVEKIVYLTDVPGLLRTWTIPRAWSARLPPRTSSRWWTTGPWTAG